MKRAEIVNQIEFVLYNEIQYAYDATTIKLLTDLFIQLSDRRCEEQREICALIDETDEFVDYDGRILNAPLPEIY